MRKTTRGRLTRLIAMPLLAILAAACLDGPTGPLTIGELRLLPMFAPGEDPAALGLTIDSMRVTATRGSAGTVIDTVMPFTSGATLSWLIDLTTDPEGFDVEVELYGGPDTLYAGTASPSVRLGFADGRVANEVPLQYVGAPVTSPIAEVIVRPARVTLVAIGAAYQFTAEARDGSGAVIPGVTFGWSSSATAVATIGQASGIATSVSVGNSTITATAGGVSGTASLAVDLSGSVIGSIAVAPATATLTGLGDTQPFVATAQDAAGDPVGGATFAWTSSSTPVATIDPTSGIATATGQGTTTITASVGSVSGTAQLTVDLSGPGSGIASIVVTPASATLTSIGATQQFTAQAFDAGGQPISGVTVSWSSSSASVASIDVASGLATAHGNGTTTIEATAGGVTGAASLTVDLSGAGSGIASIVVSPASATLTALGATQQYTAQAFDAGGQPISGVAFAWSSTNGLIASIDAASGLATAAGHGTTTIEATAGGVTGGATLTVDLSGPGSGISTIIVSPSTVSLGSIGETQQFAAQAFDVNGQPIFGVIFSWTSTNDAVASIDAASGLATAIANGTTTIEASAGGVTGSASLTVAQEVASIQVAPSGATLDALGLTQAFTATAFDGNGVPIAGAVFSWSSSVPSVATVDVSSGVATAVGNGQTIISASIGPVSGSAVLDVAQRVASIVVAPSVVELAALGATAQFTATAFDGSGNAMPGVFVWSSSDPAIATVDPVTGLATAIDGGDAIISATAQGVTGTATLLVRP